MAISKPATMKPKGAPGRPRKDASDKLEQFSIRLSPRLKFGLEMLARAQNRSLSQAIEWSLLVGLNNYRVNNDWGSVADLLDHVWKHEHPYDRANAIYETAPSLLTFEDRAACELIHHTIEYQATFLTGVVGDQTAHLETRLSDEEVAALDVLRRSVLEGFIREFWSTIRDAASEHLSTGQPKQTWLLELAGFRKGARMDEFALMQAHTESALGKLAPDQLNARILELDMLFPWSLNRGIWTGSDLTDAKKGIFSEKVLSHLDAVRVTKTTPDKSRLT